MPANIDSMLYVREVPWHGLGTKYDIPPRTSYAIVEGAHIGWEVAAAPMLTEHHDSVDNYHAIYRTDNMEVVGVVNKANPMLVQNSEMFTAFEPLMASDVVVDTAASLGRGEKVFGCFKIANNFSVLDDEVTHYFVVLNEHGKSDGKVTILNTPIRVVCQNTLSAALQNNSYKIRIPVSPNTDVNLEIAKKVIECAGTSIAVLSDQAQKMVNEKTSDSYMATLMDVLFPYIQSDDAVIDNPANVVTAIRRDAFMRALDAPDLSNYRGTKYQVFNALTDFSQHMYRNPDKAYDLEYRMKLLPGMSSDSPSAIVTKFMKVKDKIAA